VAGFVINSELLLIVAHDHRAALGAPSGDFFCRCGIPLMHGDGHPPYTARMSEIIVTKAHHLTAKKARIAAEQVAADLKSQFGLDYAWEDSDVLAFRRPGLSGQLTLARKHVTVHVRLGWLLSPLRSTLEREIHDFFDRRFALPPD
jgi:putative polyhydroxyalkanoate system protein